MKYYLRRLVFTTLGLLALVLLWQIDISTLPLWRCLLGAALFSLLENIGSHTR